MWRQFIFSRAARARAARGNELAAAIKGGLTDVWFNVTLEGVLRCHLATAGFPTKDANKKHTVRVPPLPVLRNGGKTRLCVLRRDYAGTV